MKKIIFICEKVNKQLKYTLNPILKVFLLSNWAHILRGWIFLRPGFHETLFEAVEAVWNSEVTRGCLRPSKSEVKIDILRPGEVIWVSYMGSEAARGHPWSRTFSLLDPHIYSLLKWLPLVVSECQIWPQPRMPSGNLWISNSLKKGIKMSWVANKFSLVKYEPNWTSRTPSNEDI